MTSNMYSLLGVHRTTLLKTFFLTLMVVSIGIAVAFTI